MTDRIAFLIVAFAAFICAGAAIGAAIFIPFLGWKIAMGGLAVVALILFFYMIARAIEGD